MSIIIPDKYHKLEIQLTTNIPSDFTLTYKRKRGNIITNHNAVVNREENIVTFTIPFIDHETDDELYDFIVSMTSNQMYNQEVYILLDGEPIPVIQATGKDNPVKDGNNEYVKSDTAFQYFALDVTDNDIHTLQAIYLGNKSNGVSLSNILNISAEQNTNTTNGNYLLEIIQLPKSMTYMEDLHWVFRLTQNGVGVQGKSIEVDMPHGAVWTEQSDSEGYISIDTFDLTNATHLEHFRSWTVDKSSYLIQARFYDYDDPAQPMGVLYRVGRELTIKKGTPQLSFSGAKKKGKQAQFKLKDPQGKNLANKKLTINIDGKPYTKTTNSNGNVWITINKKGYKKYKVTFNGDKNLSKITKTFTETVGA